MAPGGLRGGRGRRSSALQDLDPRAGADAGRPRLDHLLGILVRDLDAELLFQSHNEFDGIQGIRPQVVHERCLGLHLVLVHAEQGFTTNLTLEDFIRDDNLFAWRYAGAELTPEHGWPLRLVVPHLYFWKSAKWVRGVEFLAKEKLGFWETHGYHSRGDPWTEERFRPGATPRC